MIKEVITKLDTLLQGKIPEKIALGTTTDEHQDALDAKLNQLIDFMEEVHGFIVPISKGEIADVSISRNNFLASPFKELHSSLIHLTWQAKQVAKGDYSQRVDFMGEFSEAFNFMIVSLEKRERELKRKIDELENALSYIKNLEGILPICANCKKIRLENADPKDQDNWVQIEGYISQKTSVQFSHSICPECMRKLYPELKCGGGKGL